MSRHYGDAIDSRDFGGMEPEPERQRPDYMNLAADLARYAQRQGFGPLTHCTADIQPRGGVIVAACGETVPTSRIDEQEPTCQACAAWRKQEAEDARTAEDVFGEPEPFVPHVRPSVEETIAQYRADYDRKFKKGRR